ncbi:MAG TPA: FtsX-like permease family protein [Opitutaceae bacterium]|nr:FtsX-like permease family protein [Opitutaceae bacterium]
MRIFLAWHNTLQNKKRSLAAIAGITFSVLLVFMQLGFLQTARTNSTIVYNYFDFDLIITSTRFEALETAGWFDKARLLQAGVIPGVQTVATLNYARTRWRDPENKNRGSSCMMLGYDLNPAFVRDPAHRAALAAIGQKDTVMLDRSSHPDYGAQRIGKEVTIENRPVTIASLYDMGVGFQAEGSVVVNLDTFQSIRRQEDRDICFGLVKVAPGVSPAEVKARLVAALPRDVVVFTKPELVTRESDYYVNVKPIGIMFRAGAFVAFCVGGVILYQVLASEISNRLRELATLKAVGFTVMYVYGVGVQQALLFAGMSYGPAFVFSLITFRLVYWASHIPMFMTWSLALIVLGLSVAMTSVSSVLALQKVKRADPADLF